MTIAVAEAGPVQQALYAWAIGVGQRAAPHWCSTAVRFPASLKAQFMLARWLALDNVRRLIGIHRALPRHRRGADLARPGALVHGAGRADARGLGPDRVRRRVDRHARRRIKPGSIGPACSYNEVKVDPPPASC